MKQVTTIGLDLAKAVFQVHGVDASGVVTLRRAVRRRQVLSFFAKLPPCLVGMEACATAHYWAREIAKLGDDVRLIPPAYAKAYVRRNKNDPADAEPICEAVSVMASSVNRRIEGHLSRVMGQRDPRGLDQTSIHGTHQGLRFCAAPPGRTHDCNWSSMQTREKILASRGPSTHDLWGFSQQRARISPPRKPGRGPGP